MLQPPKFINETLQLQALTHRSYTNENPGPIDHNERLKFLGNSLLAFIVGELLFINYPELGEYQLIKLRTHLIEENQLTSFARELKLGKVLRLGKGTIKDGGRENPAILSEAFSALIGAYYLDGGMSAVREYVENLYSAIAHQLISTPEVNEEKNSTDPKNHFQKWTLANFTQNPEYQIISESGPPHAREFVAVVKVNKLVYGKGVGKRKQDATKAAAEAALKNVGLV
ncbi:MAG: Ribonuclease 3 [Chroococcopsis gigantea SAG 12.99]|jgi:ribonuclease-3|nr:ribonuclease III [Chlorogloea purpurea SAG 13.99]MDV3001549.1 Ribonuclease 3 [Chroococcopsis gigantea SAG 12.99]